ncbi:MAG TPA: hypothetical protein VFW55_01735, partial [Propionicimonas sp.]|nr:hypothetical protein [Propionicimonas sp.]
STAAPVGTPTPMGDDATQLGQQQATNSEPSGESGSPVGALVAAGLVVAGSAGAGGWWLLKGRRR